MKVLLIKQIPEHSTSSESSKEGGEEDILDKKEDKEVSQRQKLNLTKWKTLYWPKLETLFQGSLKIARTLKGHTEP